MSSVFFVETAQGPQLLHACMYEGFDIFANLPAVVWIELDFLANSQAGNVPTDNDDLGRMYVLGVGFSFQTRKFRGQPISRRVIPLIKSIENERKFFDFGIAAQRDESHPESLHRSYGCLYSLSTV